MFIGQYYHTLEAKNRLSLPKTFREQENHWILTRGLDGGLLGFRHHEFETQLQELSSRTFTLKSNRDFIRLMANDATEVMVDDNGRVQLPEYLISLAKLQKQIVVVGSFKWIEIWDVETYHQYRDTLDPQATQISEVIGQDLTNHV